MIQNDSKHQLVNSKDIVEALGFSQPLRVRLWPLVLVVVVVIIFVASLLALEATDMLAGRPPDGAADSQTNSKTTADDSPKGSTVAAAVLALGAFIVGYHQWRAGRREASMDRFYDRLEIANDRLAALEGVDPFAMYVFAELDNLEYTIEKYRLGYMSPDQALRGLRTFQSRLKSSRGERFQQIVTDELDRAAYSPNTKMVVQSILSQSTTTGAAESRIAGELNNT